MVTNLGLIGIGIMGQNLALNIESKGYSVTVYDKEKEKTQKFIKGKAKGKNITPSYSFKELISSLKKPRKIMLLVPAGKAVDLILRKLIPLLEKGDIIIDGGNSYFKHTNRRNSYLKDKGIYFIGLGISGGEKGALLWPSMMAGGQKEA